MTLSLQFFRCSTSTPCTYQSFRYTVNEVLNISEDENFFQAEIYMTPPYDGNVPDGIVTVKRGHYLNICMQTAWNLRQTSGYVAEIQLLIIWSPQQ